MTETVAIKKSLWDSLGLFFDSAAHLGTFRVVNPELHKMVLQYQRCIEAERKRLRGKGEKK
jgi:hypothetical protein